MRRTGPGARIKNVLCREPRHGARLTPVFATGRLEVCRGIGRLEIADGPDAARDSVGQERWEPRRLRTMEAI